MTFISFLSFLFLHNQQYIKYTPHRMNLPSDCVVFLGQIVLLLAKNQTLLLQSMNPIDFSNTDTYYPWLHSDMIIFSHFMIFCDQIALQSDMIPQYSIISADLSFLQQRNVIADSWGVHVQCLGNTYECLAFESKKQKSQDIKQNLNYLSYDFYFFSFIFIFAQSAIY